jgi:plastocyanin
VVEHLNTDGSRAAALANRNTGRTLVMARFTVLVVLAGLAFSAGLQGCGKTSPLDNNGTPGADEIWMSGNAFVPDAKTVTPGTTITWTNKNSAIHNVHQTSGPVPFMSPDLGQGGSWSFTFDSTGTYTYQCDFHPGMAGTITVEP